MVRLQFRLPEAMVVTELRWKDFVKKNGLGADEGLAAEDSVYPKLDT